MMVTNCACLSSPSPAGREYEIRTTDIIGNDYEAPQPEDGHCRTDGPSESHRGSSAPQDTKELHSNTLPPVQTESHNHCPAPAEPAPTSPLQQQQHCSPDTPSAAPTQNTSSCDPAAPTASVQGLSQAPSSPVRPAPPTEPHPSEAAAMPASQVVSQPQSQTAAQSSGSRPAQVVGPSPAGEAHTDASKPVVSATSQSPATSSSPQPTSSSMEGSPVSDTPVPGFATLGRRLMLSGSDLHQGNHVQHHHRYPTHNPQLQPPSYSNYSTISIPLPHPQPPLPEKRHPPTQAGSPNDGAAAMRAAGGHLPPSTTSSSGGQHQHHVTFSPTVGEIAPSGGQNDRETSIEAENATRVSVKFVQDSSRFWYKPGISREQGGSDRVELFASSIYLQKKQFF